LIIIFGPFASYRTKFSIFMAHYAIFFREAAFSWKNNGIFVVVRGEGVAAVPERSCNFGCIFLLGRI